MYSVSVGVCQDTRCWGGFGSVSAGQQTPAGSSVGAFAAPWVGAGSERATEQPQLHSADLQGRGGGEQSRGEGRLSGKGKHHNDESMTADGRLKDLTGTGEREENRM